MSQSSQSSSSSPSSSDGVRPSCPNFARAPGAPFPPELFILGGGASKKPEKFLHHLDVPCEVVAAELRNEAGIVGAAAAARPDSAKPD